MAFTTILFLCEHRWAKKRKKRKLSYLRREKRPWILVLLRRSVTDAQSLPAPHKSSSHWCGISSRNVAMISSSACQVPGMSGCLLISPMYAKDDHKEYVPGNLNRKVLICLYYCVPGNLNRKVLIFYVLSI